MTLFQIILTGAIFVIGACAVSGIVLMLRTKDILTRGVLSDLVFYSMLAMYLIWTLTNPVSIVYDVALLGAIVAGVMPTLATSRIISKGRR